MGLAFATLVLAQRPERRLVLSSLVTLRGTAAGWAFALGFSLLLAAITARSTPSHWDPVARACGR